MGCADILLLDVGIDHRGIQGGVAEQLLNVLHRRAVGQRGGGKRVAEDMRGNGDRQLAGTISDCFYLPLQAFPGYVAVRSAGPAEQGGGLMRPAG